jgi:predicted ester cyclase
MRDDRDQNPGGVGEGGGLPSSNTDRLAPGDNVGIVRRLLENVWGRGEYWLLPEIIAAEYVGHLPIGDHYGPDGVRIDVQGYRTLIPDLAVRIDDLFAVGDKVVRRYVIHGTGSVQKSRSPIVSKCIELQAIAVDRIACGQLRESWVHLDQRDGWSRFVAVN